MWEGMAAAPGQNGRLGRATASSVARPWERGSAAQHAWLESLGVLRVAGARGIP